MTINAKRETLYQLIEDLSESNLLEVTKFIESLLTQKEPENNQEVIGESLWAEVEDQTVILDNLIEAISKTPPNDQAITLPAKNWTDFVANTFTRIDKDATDKFDFAAWDQQWDVLEAKMEANSLAHEMVESRDYGS